MHSIEFSPAMKSLALRRRGRLEVFDSLDPQRTALLVIDLQRGFLEPGSVCEVPFAREIVPTVNRIAGALRDRGGQVVYVQNTWDSTALEQWSVYFEHFCGAERRETMIAHFTPGNPGHELAADLDVREEDWVVGKRHFSAFAPGVPDLADRLKGAGIDTVIVTGTTTNFCCESTARDAMMLNFRVFFVADATATLGDREHNATLSTMAYGFADVTTADRLVTLIGQAD